MNKHNGFLSILAIALSVVIVVGVFVAIYTTRKDRGEIKNADKSKVDVKEPSAPSEFNLDDYISKDDPLRMEARDLWRISDLRLLASSLDYYYFYNHNTLPESLDVLEVALVISPPFPRDPLDKSQYIYARQASGKGYHLGANFEYSKSSNTGLGFELDRDADCNSVSGENCFRGKTYVNGFNGSDSLGCRGERSRFCYDIEK